jgi:hypothetical protein
MSINDYYFIGGCILYIIGIGFCAYRCSTLQEEKLCCLDGCCAPPENHDYESINENV